MNKEIAVREETTLASLTLDANEVGNAMQNAVTLGQIVERRFKEGHHYMHIPGTPKDQRPHLCDPGISLIAAGYHLRPEYRVLESVTDEEGNYSVALEASYIHIPTGAKVSAGIGTATTKEVKYAYRWVGLAQVPSGLDRTLLTTRERRGDGAKQYRINNPDMGDLYNTIWKMAAKRAEGDAVLKLPGCSELFGGYKIDPPRARQEAPKEPSKPETPPEVVAPKSERSRLIRTFPMLQKRIGELTADADWDYCSAWLAEHIGKDEVTNNAEAQVYVEWLEAGLPEWRNQPQPTEEAMQRDSADLFGGR